MSAPRPRPAAVGAAERFWSAVAAGEVRLQRCRACGAYRHPPRPVCPECRSGADEWVPASGGGEVWSFTICHPPVLAAFAARVPYAAVVVRLDEGVFMVSNVVDAPPDGIEIGARVTIECVAVDEGLVLPQFRLALPS